MAREIIDWPREWWPTVTAQFALVPRSQRSQSPWSQKQNIYGPHVQFWAARFTYKTLTNVEAAARETVIEMLGGGAVLLRIGHPLRAIPQYTREKRKLAVTEPFDDGSTFTDGSGMMSGLLPPLIFCTGAAKARTTSVPVGGLPTSKPAVLRRGDLVEFRRGGIASDIPSLHRVVRNAPTNVAGETRIEFLPPLRAPLIAGDAVVLEFPTSVFRLADDNQGAIDYTGSSGAQGFALVEALR